MKQPKQSLAELLQVIPPETIIKIGAESGFFYIGSAGQLLENCDGYDRQLKKYWKEMMESAQAEYHTKRNNPPTVDRYIEAVFPKGAEKLGKMPLMNVDHYNSFVETYFAALKRAYDKWISLIKKRNALKPLMIRTVDEYYKSDPVVDRSLIVIIEGYEPGPLWLMSEAEKWGAFVLRRPNQKEDEEDE